MSETHTIQCLVAALLPAKVKVPDPGGECNQDRACHIGHMKDR